MPYGGSATYTGTTPVSPDGSADDGYEFTGFVPTGSNITGTTSCYAQYTSPMQVVEITDDWDTIRRNVAANIHHDKYSVGNYKSLDLGDEGTVTMQIVAMNADETEDGSKAPITWVARELLKTSHRMNAALSGDATSGYVEGTGTIGGWEKSEMRTYLNDTVKPLIPEAVRSRIATVTKTQPAYDTTGASVTQTTLDDVWIPSGDELNGSTGLYHEAFPDNASRVKRKPGSASAEYWWLRSAVNSNIFEYIYSTGTKGNDFAGRSYNVALGFCLN